MKTTRQPGALETVADRLGAILAFLTVALILLIYISGAFDFIPAEIMNILMKVREIAIIAVLGLTGLEFALKGRWLLTILFLAMLAGVVIFMWFPGAIPEWIIPAE